jgi:hypothetical protein
MSVAGAYVLAALIFGALNSVAWESVMMRIRQFQSQLWRGSCFSIVALMAMTAAAVAGNGANFVTYDHHMGKKGETEIIFFNEAGRAAGDGERYIAQLAEIEHALTNQWAVAAYLESHMENGEDWSFDGARFETRYRLFEHAVPLNPVVYLEYINKKEGARFLREATGRTSGGKDDEVEESARASELETKLILGHDVSDKLRLGFDWISEVNLKSGDWAFGYAAGLTYIVFESVIESDAKHGGWNVKEVALGAELFGGAGDSVKGLTLDGSTTQQYAGASVKTEFSNGAFLTFGGTFGLTRDSRDALFRAAVGWEFE